MNTITVTDTWFPQLRDVAPAAVQPQLDIYTEAMTAGGHEAEINGFAVTSFAAIMELSGIMTGHRRRGHSRVAHRAALGERQRHPRFHASRRIVSHRDLAERAGDVPGSLLFLQVNAGPDGAPERTLLGDDFVDLSSFAF